MKEQTELESLVRTYLLELRERGIAPGHCGSMVKSAGYSLNGARTGPFIL